jgi:hypothetical protein
MREPSVGLNGLRSALVVDRLPPHCTE